MLTNRKVIFEIKFVPCFARKKSQFIWLKIKENTLLAQNILLGNELKVSFLSKLVGILKGLAIYGMYLYMYTNLIS